MRFTDMNLIGLITLVFMLQYANASSDNQEITIHCEPGTYLQAGKAKCTKCPKNNVCSGGKFIYNKKEDSGIATCASLTPEYPYSDIGTISAYPEYYESAIGCYRTTTCPKITDNKNCDPHAISCTYSDDATTTGRVYSDEESDLWCILDFQCEPGYHKATISTPNIPKSPEYNHRSKSITADILCADPDPFSPKTINIECRSAKNMDTKDIFIFDDLNAGEWEMFFPATKIEKNKKINLPQHKLKGIASCSWFPGTSNHRLWNKPSILPANTNLISTSTTGPYCWCKITSWTPYMENEVLLPGPWVYKIFMGDSETCTTECANDCASIMSQGDMYDYSFFFSALVRELNNSEQCVQDNINNN